MSHAAELNKDEYETANGSPEKKIGETEVINDEGEGEGEESDDYETDEEERQMEGDEKDEDEGEGPEEQQDTLTHLLIPNGAIAENEADYEEDDDDDDEDEDGDDDYVEEEEEDNAANALHKKRSIDEVVDKEASQGSKKIKV